MTIHHWRGVLALIGSLAVSAAGAAMDPAATVAKAAADARARTSTADHSKFKALKKPFANGPEVTRACLECHTEAAKQIHKTQHWTWEFLNPANQQKLGKKNVINNYCTAVESNYEFCTACHVGYDWKDTQYDFSREDKVDCLVCHDTTGTYKKLPGLAGHPAYTAIEYPPGSGKAAKPVDLNKVAQSVGRSSRDTCGACHFLAGGGDAVKHGDLDTTLKKPGKYLDVHMDASGLNFTCGTCHMAEGHQVPGSRYAPTGVETKDVQRRGEKTVGRNAATCQSCHGQTPHEKGERAAKLNDHTDRIACQTCHIPQFARGQATKMRWDWSTAGKLDANGKPMELKDSAGNVHYNSKKGDSRWEKDVIPDYLWFNGNVRFTLFGDPVKEGGVTPINRFEGTPEDGRIWPVKRFTGRQPYDLESKSLIKFHTAGQDDAAYWKNFDWDKAIVAGMASAGAPYSGKYGFAETEMLWPITHMVAPREDALKCAQCHAGDGRLAEIQGIYIPGRDRIELLDQLGFGLAGLAFLGVLGHGGLRFLTARRNPK